MRKKERDEKGRRKRERKKIEEKLSRVISGSFFPLFSPEPTFLMRNEFKDDQHQMYDSADEKNIFLR